MRKYWLLAALLCVVSAGCGEHGGSTFSNAPPPPAPPSGTFSQTTRQLLKGGQVDASALPGAGGSLSVALNSSLTVTVELQAPVANSDGSRSWSGHVVGEPLSSVVIVESGGLVTGFLTCSAGSFELHWLGDGRLQVRASQGVPRCGGAHRPPANARPAVRAKTDATAAETVINLYVVYNQPVLTNLGSAAAVQAQAQAFISQSNSCYNNSQVDVRLNLVGAEQVTYTQASNTSVQSSDLDALANGAAFASIRAKRNTVGADLIVLLLDLNPAPGQSFTSGIGFTPDKASGLTPDAGFSVVSLDGFSNFTFAHEVGHNFGCQHDAAQNPPTPAQALYPFAFGQRRVGSWATVMAYPQGSEINIPNFSNPGINFEGNPTGVAGVTDNHQAMNLSASAVAAWAPNPSGSPLPSPSPGASPSASPTASASPTGSPSASPTGGAINVQLAAGWNGVGFQRQQLSTVTSNSAVAGMATWDGTAYQTNSLTAATVNTAGTRQGFFVFATGATNFTYAGANDGQGNFLNLKSGWNLAAFVTDVPIPGANLTASVNGSPVPLGNVVLTSFSEIQPNLSYNTVNIQSGGQVRPGFAYWIFANGNVRLSWGAGGPTGSPSPAGSPTAGASPTPSPNASPPARVVRASQSSTGAQTDVDSNVGSGGQISTDGRWGVFSSSATNLVTNDTNNATDCFIHDRLTGQTQRVSLGDGATQAPNGGTLPSVSGDGRRVAFSATGPLFTGDLASGGIYVYDRSNGRTIRASKASDGTLGTGSFPRLSSDGRYVVFESSSTILVPGDTNTFSDVFLHDTQTGNTTRVSVGPGGVQANGVSFAGRISADSRFVLFESVATNLVAGDTNNLPDGFIYEIATGAVTRLAINATGGSQPGYQTSGISQDGNLILVESRSSSLANSTSTMVYVHNRTTGNTTLVSAFNGSVANQDCNAASFSGDGRLVVFQTTATNLGVEDTNNQTDLYLVDRTTGNITRPAGGVSGLQAVGDSTEPTISRDGTTLLFQSTLTQLVPNDTNNRQDVFMLRLP